ncbi:adenylate/guanylate cyclase domain-containing protein [Priestia filamentosa]|uniref:adenylate/guanylate cyclase domain-containing protein n=1 Tax=Priestia filamentosa TaxID=1402861 RepID=UPI00397B8D1D
MPEITEENLTEIKEKIKDIFTSDMEVDDYTGDTVPSTNDLPDKNKGLILTNCAILFVDIRSSTQLSDRSQAKSMAKIYRAFARAMSMCVYSCGGSVRQIAGDRVMGVFIDDEEESSVNKALAAGRAIITVVDQVFNPLCKSNVNNKTIECGVGIDLGRVLTTSVGIEHEEDDSRDLVWAGKIANVASKHTDLAEAGEIFVTDRFYNKLPKEKKQDENGKDIWSRHYRIKGTSIFEGYGIENYYVELFNEQEERQAVPLTKETFSLSQNQGMNKKDSLGINEGEIITNIVEGVRKQTKDLLQRFENVIHRERDVLEKEKSCSQREKALAEKEQELEKREVQIKRREIVAELNIDTIKDKAMYEVKVNFLRNNIYSYSLEACLKQIEEIKDLAEKIGKTPAEYKLDLYYTRLVDYFKDREISIAYSIIKEQLTNELSYVLLPSKNNVVNIVKKLGKEQEYLNIVIYHLQTFKPGIQRVLQLSSILKDLGFKENVIENSPLLKGN